jgi:hypothetical protein
MSRSQLTVPEHPELPPEVRQAYVEVDRKFGVFILPQLEQLGAKAAVERLMAQGGELAEQAAGGTNSELVVGYQALLAEAQRELREARTEEVVRGAQGRDQRQHGARLDSALAAARSQLPASRMARLQVRLSELAAEGVELADRLAVVDGAVLEWDRLNQTRQAREADRLATQAHMPIRPRQTETSRSRKALRDQARIVELAKAFSAPGSQALPGAEPDREEAVAFGDQ